MAQFPDQSEYALIKLSWLERARQRVLRNPIGNGESSLIAGIDVSAGGEAETVAYVCDVKVGNSKIIALGGWRGEDTRGQVVNFLNRFRPRLSPVRVETIGPGIILPTICAIAASPSNS